MTDRQWRDLRNRIEAELVDEDRWKVAFNPMLDEAMAAFKTGADLRALAQENPLTTSPKSGRAYLNPAFAGGDREMRRGSLLIARIFAAAGPPAVPPEPTEDPFAELDAFEAKSKSEGVKQTDVRSA